MGLKLIMLVPALASLAGCGERIQAQDSETPPTAAQSVDEAPEAAVEKTPADEGAPEPSLKLRDPVGLD